MENVDAMQKAIHNWIDSLLEKEKVLVLFEDMWEYLTEYASEDERQKMIEQYGDTDQ